MIFDFFNKKRKIESVSAYHGSAADDMKKAAALLSVHRDSRVNLQDLLKDTEGVELSNASIQGKRLRGKHRASLILAEVSDLKQCDTKIQGLDAAANKVVRVPLFSVVNARNYPVLAVALTPEQLDAVDGDVFGKHEVSGGHYRISPEKRIQKLLEIFK